jgi:polyisoprenoid-binding protein YceI
MQGHFNGENWMNSDKYPKFTFKGKIDDLSKVDFTKDGTYAVSVTGDLTIRDITKPVTTPGTIIVKGGLLNVTTAFSVKLADYQITGVPVDAGKVSKEPKITVAADLK